MVAGAIKVYSWKNKTRTTKDFRELLEKFLMRNKMFSVRSLETISGYGRAMPTISRNKTTRNNHRKTGNDSRKQAYYYISKLLKKGIIKKIHTYEKQGYGQKPLMIYEVLKTL